MRVQNINRLLSDRPPVTAAIRASGEIRRRMFQCIYLIPSQYEQRYSRDQSKVFRFWMAQIIFGFRNKQQNPFVSCNCNIVEISIVVSGAVYFYSFHSGSIKTLLCIFQAGVAQQVGVMLSAGISFSRDQIGNVYDDRSLFVVCLLLLLSDFSRFK